MSRYLTPAKVCLLALIEVFLDGHVGETVPVLSFLIKSISPSKNVAPAPLPLEAFGRTLSSIKSSKPGRSVWDVFLDRLWLFECADSLHAFFDDLEHLIKKPKPPEGEAEEEDEDEARDQDQGIRLVKTSPLGAFVRRAQLEFTRLNFADSNQLWKNFVVYRQPTFGVWAKRAGSAAAASNRSTIDTNLELMTTEKIRDIAYGDLLDADSPGARYSTEDVERLLDYCVSSMTRTGNRLPDDIRDRMVELAAGGSITVPSASHYVRYLDAWKAGDYPTALDSLHRYFDYTIQTRDGRSHYQYALLNMALLHAHFGAYDEAVSAMQETVATARENKDSSCLNYTLSWLYHFGHAHPAETREIQRSGVLGRGKEALAFLQAKARETGSWGLLSGSLVADARLTMQQGDGLATAVENLVRASHLNLTKRLPAAVGATMATEAALWARLAIAPLADAKDDIFLECYAAAGAADVDAVQAVCRRAAALAARGQYPQALATMNDVSSETTLRSLTTNSTWSGQLGMLKMQHALRRQDFPAAEHYLAQLQAIAGTTTPTTSSPNHTNSSSSPVGSATGAGPETCFSIAFLHIRLEIARGELPSAFSLIDATSRQLDASRADVYHRAQLMLLKGKLWARAGQPARGFTVVLRACSIAQSARLLPLLWDGMTALAGILVSLGEFEAARDLLEAVMPHVLASMDCEGIATAYSMLAEAHVGLAGQAGTDASSEGDEGNRQQSSDGESADSDVPAAPTAAALTATAAPSVSPAASPSPKPREPPPAPPAAPAPAEDQQPATLKRKEQTNKALEYLSRAFDAWSAIDDVAGQSETLAKRAVLMMMMAQQQQEQQQMLAVTTTTTAAAAVAVADGSQLANDCAARYRDLREKSGDAG